MPDTFYINEVPSQPWKVGILFTSQIKKLGLREDNFIKLLVANGEEEFEPMFDSQNLCFFTARGGLGKAPRCSWHTPTKMEGLAPPL